MGRFDQLELPGHIKPQDESHDDANLAGQIIYDAVKYFEMADNAYWNGDYEPALRYYSKALGENPELETAWLGQVMCLIRLREYKEALLWVDKAMDKFPKSDELLGAKAIVHARLKDSESALNFADAAISSRKNSTFLWLARGDALYKINPKNAGYCINKALEMGKKDWRVWVSAGDASRENARFREALKYYLKAADLNHQNARTWLMIGLCRFELGLSGHQDAFKQAIEIRPDWEFARKKSRETRRKSFRKIFRRFIFWR